MTDEHDYLRQNYGLCANPIGCACMKAKKWYGTACPFWKPVPCDTLEQFRQGMLTARDMIKKAEGLK